MLKRNAIFTARKRSLRRLCFHRCLSVHGGVSASLYAGIHPPRQTPPWADTPTCQTPPTQCMLGYTPLPIACWNTHTPAQCILGYTPPAQCMLGYGQQAGGTHPTAKHSCGFKLISLKFFPSRMEQIQTQQ